MEKGLSSFLVHLLIMIVRGYIMMLIGWGYISHCCWIVTRLGFTLFSGYLNGWDIAIWNPYILVHQSYLFCTRICNQLLHAESHWLQREVCGDSCIVHLSFKWQLLRSREKTFWRCCRKLLVFFLPILLYSVVVAHRYVCC